MPWVYVPKRGGKHVCKRPVGMFKPLGSRWRCPDCNTLYVKTVDRDGSFMMEMD